MHEINSLGIFIGTGFCNGRCKHCAGVPLRKYAPKNDGLIDKELISRTIIDCYKKGARSITISSSGEPTLSPLAVTKLLYLLKELNNENIVFDKINLYTNGIRIGIDKKFSDEYLPKWKYLGLTHIYLTVHNIDEKKNAEIYGVKYYPSLKLIIKRIKVADLILRVNLVLSKYTINNLSSFKKTALYLTKIGADSISAWPIRGLDDKRDKRLSPSNFELVRIHRWVKQNNLNIRLLLDSNRSDYALGKKLTLFPNGILSSSWCN